MFCWSTTLLEFPAVLLECPCYAMHGHCIVFFPCRRYPKVYLFWVLVHTRAVRTVWSKFGDEKKWPNFDLEYLENGAHFSWSVILIIQLPVVLSVFWPRSRHSSSARFRQICKKRFFGQRSRSKVKVEVMTFSELGRPYVGRWYMQIWWKLIAYRRKVPGKETKKETKKERIIS